MGLAIFISISLVAVTFLFHYRVLLWLGFNTTKLRVQTQTQVLVIVLVLFVAHLTEIGFYAVVYHWSVSQFGLGQFQGGSVGDPMSYLYYSGVIYTTLGLGDISPQGHIRFITATEALNGFLLITWSASFTFLVMGRLWPWEPTCKPSGTRR